MTRNQVELKKSGEPTSVKVTKKELPNTEILYTMF